MKTYKTMIYGLCLATLIGCGTNKDDFSIETTRGLQHVRVWNGNYGKGIALEDTLSGGAIAGEFHGEDIINIYISNVKAGNPFEKYANPDSLRKIYKETSPK